MSGTLKSFLIVPLLLGLNIPAMARQAVKSEVKSEMTITLRVYDYAGLEAGLLRRALDEAGFIVGDAGVTVAPILCTQDNPPAACRQVPDPLNIAVRIVPKPVPGADYGTLGYAAGQYITVNYSRVEKFADHSDVYLDRILGCVIAHELGHLLLGPDSHSARGIMKANISDQELGQIRTMQIGFLPEQKARIRAYLLLHARGRKAGTGVLTEQ